MLPNGTRTLGDKCVSQAYKNCADIKIKQKQGSPVYKSNPVWTNYQKYNGPPVFQWYFMDMVKDNKGNIVRLNQPDPLQYKANGIYCSVDNKFINDSIKSLPGNYQENFNLFFWSVGQNCRQNCMSPSKTCPRDCYCRWYNLDRYFASNTVEQKIQNMSIYAKTIKVTPSNVFKTVLEKSSDEDSFDLFSEDYFLNYDDQ